MDLWITGTTPEVFAARQLHVYMLIWDRNDPRSINRVTLSQGKLMTYRDGSLVPYFFASHALSPISSKCGGSISE